MAHRIGRLPGAVSLEFLYSIRFLPHRGRTTSCFKLTDPNFVIHEWRLKCQYLLECHIFCIILTAMNSGSE